MNRKLTLEKYEKIIPYIVFTITFLLFAFVSYAAPLESDDLFFSGMHFADFGEIVDYSLGYGNGRLLGNIGAVFMSHHKWVSVLVRGLSVAALSVLIPAAARVKNKAFYLVSFLLVTCCSIGMFTQSYSWLSGFQNYVPPVVFFLFVCFVAERYDEMPKALKVLSVPFCAVIAFIMQLYVEHCSVMFVICSVAFVIYSFVKTKKARVFSLFVSAAAIAGLAVMYLIPKIYITKENITKGYRQILFTSPLKIARNAFLICENISSNSLFIVLLAAALMYIILSNRDIFGKKETKRLIFGMTFSLIFILVQNYVFSDDYNGRWKFVVFALISVFFVLFILCAAYVLYKCTKKYTITRTIVCIAVAVLCCGMLLFVSPIGTRCLFFPYVMLCIALMCFVEDTHIADLTISHEKVRLPALCTVITVCVAVTFSLFLQFCGVKFTADIRTKYIEDEMSKGATEITIFSIPYSRVTHDSAWAYRCRYFREEYEDVEFNMVSYESWLMDHDEYSERFLPWK